MTDVIEETRILAANQGPEELASLERCCMMNMPSKSGSDRACIKHEFWTEASLDQARYSGTY